MYTSGRKARSSRARRTGKYYLPEESILYTLAMIDEGELDWKVIGVSTADPKVV